MDWSDWDRLICHVEYYASCVQSVTGSIAIRVLHFPQSIAYMTLCQVKPFVSWESLIHFL